MMTFAPRGYGGFPSFQFSPPNQIINPYYNDGYRRQNAYFAPHYPSRPLYQPPFYPVKRHRSSRFDRARQPNIGEQLVMALEEIDEQYRYDQYLRKLEKLQRQYWKLQGSRMPLPMYSAPEPLPPPLSYNPGSLIEYPNPTQYMTYPPVIDPGAGSYGPPLNTGYSLPFNRGYGSGPTVNLPPKIRVIFIPPGQSFSQQPCTGPLVSSLFNFLKKERNNKNNYVYVFLGYATFSVQSYITAFMLISITATTTTTWIFVSYTCRATNGRTTL